MYCLCTADPTADQSPATHTKNLPLQRFIDAVMPTGATDRRTEPTEGRRELWEDVGCYVGKGCRQWTAPL